MGGQPRPSILQGRPATAWPPARGWLTVAKAPCTGAVDCSVAPVEAADYRAAPARCCSPAAWPQGLATHGEDTRATPATCAGVATTAVVVQRGKRRTYDIPFKKRTIFPF
ncbi:hypothetical protein B296_00037698 [Ensete ventricosum]|uniref:Uncharacterized protein n=1 Tax=Ensete ventricosum TaxID=4639 RepID=A0A426YAI2_ENSVE|nr:hypothetical protein B296_00037698 [Ensete ventricosum]